MNFKQDLYWDFGTSWGVDIACNNSDGDDIDLSLSGTTVLFWMGSSTQKKITCTLGSGVELDEDDPSIARIDISPFQQTSAGIANLDAKMRYEFWVTEPNGSESRQAFGSVYINVSLAKKFP